MYDSVVTIFALLHICMYVCMYVCTYVVKHSVCQLRWIDTSLVNICGGQDVLEYYYWFGFVSDDVLIIHRKEEIVWVRGNAFLFHSIVHYLYKFECAVFVIRNSVTVCILKRIVKKYDLNEFYNWKKNYLETTGKSRFFLSTKNPNLSSSLLHDRVLFEFMLFTCTWHSSFWIYALHFYMT